MKQSIILLFLFLSVKGISQSEVISFDALLDQSNTTEKPIMLVFSGSDWCKPCIQLKKNILDTDVFQSYADKLQFLYLDFPYKKANRLSKEATARNESLADKYNPKGIFPQVVLIDGDESIIGEITYGKSMTVDTFIEEVESLINQ